MLVGNASKFNVMIITTKQKALHTCDMDINRYIGRTHNVKMCSWWRQMIYGIIILLPYIKTFIIK